MMKTDDATSARPLVSFSNRARTRNGQWRTPLLMLFGAALLVAIVAGFWPKPVAVDAALVTRGPLIVTVLEEGQTRIRHRYVISPPVAGYLNRVPLRAGAAIQAGKTVLATIKADLASFLDPRAHAEAQARVKAAEAIHMQRTAEVVQAKAALDLARKEFARADAVIKEQAISRQEWDNAKTSVRLRTQELSSAEFVRRASEFEVEQARATLQQASHSKADSASSLQIIAPIDGVVLNVHEENARSVAVGTPIMEIGDPRDLEVEIELLSSDAVAVAPGAEVILEQWGGGTPLRGRVSLVEPGGFTKISALGVEEQRVKVRVDFLEALPLEDKLGDRYRVEARIVTWQGEDILQVPTGALFRRGNEWMSFVVENGTARLRTIKIAHNNGLAAEVRSGLTEGESVILYPPDNVTDGAAVSASSEPSSK